MSHGLCNSVKIVLHTPIHRQHCMLLGHKNNACKLSSSSSKKGQCEGQLTTLALGHSLVGKQPHVTLHRKFLIQGGVLVRQN